MDKHNNLYGAHLHEKHWYVDDEGIHETTLGDFLKLGDDEIPNFATKDAAFGFAISAICGRLKDIEENEVFNSNKEAWKRFRVNEDAETAELWRRLEEATKELSGRGDTEV